MFGAFKPSVPLSGGLLWKIPWRLSPPQKLRQRRRLRRVDNVVAVLSTALKNASTSSSQSVSSTHDRAAPNSPSNQATTPELSTTAEGQRLISSLSPLETRRHGRGPKQGDYVPVLTPHGVHKPGSKMLRDVVQAEGSLKRLERWRASMPTEGEMLARDKYTIFDKKVRGYRKGVHKLPKWTRVSQRVNPPGF